MFLRSIAIVSALMFSLSGCVGDDSSTTTDSASTTNTTQTTQTTSPTTNPTSTGSSTDVSGSDSDAMTSSGSTAVTEGTTAATATDPTDATTGETTTDSATDGSSGTTDSGSTGTTDGTGTGTGGEEDPGWPKPDVDNPMMPCPEGFVAASFVMGGLVCAPECKGINNSCPQPEMGSAMGLCLFNPDSTGAMCMEGDKCEDEMENCQMTGGGGFACLKPVSHCVLLCQGGETCPAGMECSGDLVCQYPA